MVKLNIIKINLPATTDAESENNWNKYMYTSFFFIFDFQPKTHVCLDNFSCLIADEIHIQ